MEDKREAGETAAGLRLCWIRASRTCVRVLEKKKILQTPTALIEIGDDLLLHFFSHVPFLNEEVSSALKRKQMQAMGNFQNIFYRHTVALFKKKKKDSFYLKN